MSNEAVIIMGIIYFILIVSVICYVSAIILEKRNKTLFVDKIGFRLMVFSFCILFVALFLILVQMFYGGD